MTIGDRIRQRRGELNISGAELARRAEVTKGYVSQIENGQVPRPSAEVLYRLANALGTTIADLLGKEVVPERTELSESLRQFVEQENLPSEDIEMLASIKFRGRQPRTVKEWGILYWTIRQTSAEDDG